MSSAAANAPLAIEVLAVQKLWYNKVPNAAVGIFLIFSSQCLGYGNKLPNAAVETFLISSSQALLVFSDVPSCIPQPCYTLEIYQSTVFWRLSTVIDMPPKRNYDYFIGRSSHFLYMKFCPNISVSLNGSHMHFFIADN
jgi:hypothetical protein